MPDREATDFTSVITDLTFRDGDIVAAASTLTNAAGVYSCEDEDGEHKYVPTFARVDERGMTWVEIFGVKLEGTTLVLEAGACSKFLGRDPGEDEKKREAVDMVKRWLGPRK